MEVVLYSLAWRAARATLLAAVAADDEREGVLHRAGQGDRVVEAVVAAGEADPLAAPEQAHHLDRLLQHLGALALRREGDAQGSVLDVVPAGAHADLEAAAAQLVDGGHLAGQHGGVAEGRRRDQGAEADAGGVAGQRGERGPGFQRRARRVGVEVEVVAAEEGVVAGLLGGAGQAQELRVGAAGVRLDHEAEDGRHGCGQASSRCGASGACLRSMSKGWGRSRRPPFPAAAVPPVRGPRSPLDEVRRLPKPPGPPAPGRGPR